MNQLTVSAALIGPGDHVVVELSLPNDNDITPVVGDLRAALSEVPSVFGLRGDNSAGRLEHKLFTNDEARIYGLTLQDLAQQTRTRFFGIEATTVQHGAENVAGIVQFPKEERNSLYDLLDTLIATAAGDLIPLGNVARIEEAIAPTQILRRDGRQITTVTGDLDTGISSAGQVNGLITAEIIHGLVAKYLDLIVAIGGEQREQGDAQSALGTALFVIYAPFGASVPVLRPADCGYVGDAARPCWCGGRPLHQRHPADDPVGLRYHRFGRRRHQQQPCYGGCLQRTYPRWYCRPRSGHSRDKGAVPSNLSDNCDDVSGCLSYDDGNFFLGTIPDPSGRFDRIRGSVRSSAHYLVCAGTLYAATLSGHPIEGSGCFCHRDWPHY